MASNLTPRITYRNLPQLFLKARESLMAHFRPILKHFGLTDQQWRILRALDEYSQLEPREICTNGPSTPERPVSSFCSARPRS